MWADGSKRTIVKVENLIRYLSIVLNRHEVESCRLDEPTQLFQSQMVLSSSGPASGCHKDAMYGKFALVCFSYSFSVHLQILKHSH